MHSGWARRLSSRQKRCSTVPIRRDGCRLAEARPPALARGGPSSPPTLPMLDRLSPKFGRAKALLCYACPSVTALVMPCTRLCENDGPAVCKSETAGDAWPSVSNVGWLLPPPQMGPTPLFTSTAHLLARRRVTVDLVNSVWASVVHSQSAAELPRQSDCLQ